MLKGEWKKFTGNDGYVRNGRIIGTTMAMARCWLAMCSVHSHIGPTSNSVCKLLVWDLQDVLNEERKYPMFELTDPAICSQNRHHGDYRYENSDIGLHDGIIR
jgi:hypothetical protein